MKAPRKIPKKRENQKSTQILFRRGQKVNVLSGKRTTTAIVLRQGKRKKNVVVKQIESHLHKSTTEHQRQAVEIRRKMRELDDASFIGSNRIWMALWRKLQMLEREGVVRMPTIKSVPKASIIVTQTQKPRQQIVSSKPTIEQQKNTERIREKIRALKEATVRESPRVLMELWKELRALERVQKKQITVTQAQRPKHQIVSTTQRKEQRKKTLIQQGVGRLRIGISPKRIKRELKRKGIRVKRIQRG